MILTQCCRISKLVLSIWGMKFHLVVVLLWDLYLIFFNLSFKVLWWSMNVSYISCISSYNFRGNYSCGNYSFLNLEIVANISNSCRNISIFYLINKLNFCCRNYSREETIQWLKIYEEMQYSLHIIIVFCEYKWSTARKNRTKIWLSILKSLFYVNNHQNIYIF